MRTITFLLLALTATPSAFAQDTIANYGDTGDGLSRFIQTDTEPFDIVTISTSSVQQGAIEFVMTELAVVYPGVFKIGTRRANDSPLDLGDNSRGEYIIGLLSCGRDSPIGPGPGEVVRVTYLDLDGTLIGPDTTLSIRGFQPGDSQPSSCDGLPCYASCIDQLHVLQPEPWSEYGMPNNEDLAGAVVLNPSWFPVDTAAISLSALKNRY